MPPPPKRTPKIKKNGKRRDKRVKKRKRGKGEGK